MTDKALRSMLWLSSLSITVATAVAGSLPWGPLNVDRRPCPIRYPFANETHFCRSVGRQRAVVSVAHTQGIACVKLPWRRRDDTTRRGIFVLDSNGTAVPGSVHNSDPVEGEVCFKPTAASPFHAIYFMPYAWSVDGGSGSYHSHPLETKAAGPTLGPFNRSACGAAKLLGIEAFSNFDERTAMELIASEAEVASLVAAYPDQKYLTWIAEVHNTTQQSPRMPLLPVALTLHHTSPNSSLVLDMAPGAVAVAQVLLFASGSAIESVAVDFSDVGRLPASSFSCLNTFGVDYRGAVMTPEAVRIEKGKLGSVLVLIELPDTKTACGVHSGSFALRMGGHLPATTFDLRVNVSCVTASARQATSVSKNLSADVWRLERLRWLNSDVGIGSTVTRPYTTIANDASEEDHVLTLLGREVTISAATGLPSKISSNGRSVLSGPMSFTAELLPDGVCTWSTLTPAQPTLVGRDSVAEWQAELGCSAANASSPILRLSVVGQLEFDGHIDISATLRSDAKRSLLLRRSALQVAVPAELARFANGAGAGDNGCFFPTGNASVLNWGWSAPPPPPPGTAGNPWSPGGWRVWLGDVDAGLFLKLKGQSLAWNSAAPRNAGTPDSWGGLNASGGIIFSEEDSGGNEAVVVLTAHGGSARGLGPGEHIVFNFSLLATPVKGDWLHTAAGKEEHYKHMRHYHVPYGQWDPPAPSDLRKELGITTQILHQSNRLNPYIDWPFHPRVLPDLAKWISDGAAVGVDVKLYYTLGQITNHAVELFALRSFGSEILLTGNSSDKPQPPGPANKTMRERPGGLEGMGCNGRPDDGCTLLGNEWLETHLVDKYSGGWFTQNPGGDEDASIGDNTTSRFLNYYIEGQDFLFDRLGVSGLYYDGFNGERFVQQRIRRMTEERGRDRRERDLGVTPNSSSRLDLTAFPRYDVHGRAFMNTELLPFVDSMWTCEGIDFSQGPAYWLISISALPFGTFGEMLGADSVPPVPGKFCGESCANKWRGMLFGMTNRAGWNGHDPNDNAGLWRLWDSFGIEKADMLGWWNASAPVKVDVAEQEGSTTVTSEVLATSYVRHGTGTLVAIASWSPSNVNVTLDIDWDKLGLNEKNGCISAPGLVSFNRASSRRYFNRGGVFAVPALEGWLLELTESSDCYTG